MSTRLIDPDETLDFSRDWSAFLDEGGSPSDSIQTSTWSITPSGPTLSGASLSGNLARVFVSGAVVGRVYRLTDRVTTQQGRTAERSITLRCENR